MRYALAMRRSHVVIVMALCLVGAGGSHDPGPAAGDCPQGFHLDEPRADRLLAYAHLASPSSSSSSITSQKRMCFGKVNVSLVTEDGFMLLDEDAEDRRGAARVAHLASHLAHRSLFDPTKRTGTCDAWVDSVLDAEAEAFAIEMDVARDLHVELPYAFARGGRGSESSNDPAVSARENESLRDAGAATTTSKRVELIAAFLRTHPDGDRNIEPLARGYEERCRGHD